MEGELKKESKAIAVLMATHPRLGAKSVLPDDVTILIAVRYYEEVS
jgi:hypothetical protein